MNWRKHTGLFIGAGIMLVLIILATVLFFLFQGNYRKVKKDLARETRVLQNLHDRQPFPSLDNVEKLMTNQEILESYFESVQAQLSQGNFAAMSLEPAEFPMLLEQTFRRLSQASGIVQVEDAFAFGFDRYAKGTLPRKRDLDRLVTQLKSVEHISEMIMDSDVDALLSMKREVFEEQAETVDVRESRRSVSRPDRNNEPAPSQPEDRVQHGLYMTETVNFEIETTRAALVELLNKLASNQPVTVIKHVDIQNEKGLADKSSLVPSGGGTKETSSPGQPAPVKQQDDRVIAGRELLTVTIEVDVYQFITREEEQTS